MTRHWLDYNAGEHNPNGLYLEAREDAAKIARAREQVATAIKAQPEEVFFFPSASLVNYFLAQQFAIQCGPFEHPSLLAYAGAAAKPPLISQMLVNNETGDIYDLAGAQHSDLAQAFGKMPIDVVALGLDFATLSAAKIGGGRGAAALYARGGRFKLPLALGTPNVAAIERFGRAAARVPELLAEWKRVEPLRDELRRRIVAEIPQVVVNTSDHAVPNTLNVSFPGAEGESVMLLLDEAGLAVSTGSACSTADGQPSHVLMAMYADRPAEEAAEIAHSSIRFSLPPDVAPDIVERVMAVLPGIVTRLRGIATEVA